MVKKYKLLPEHKARFSEWRDRWIANAMSTEAMTSEDRAACVEAVHGVYAAANLPPPKHIVFVPSPFVLAFAGGFAAARWHKAKAATRAATEAATRAATDYSRWYVIPCDMRAVAEALGVGDFGLQCAAKAWKLWSGGNQWAGYDAFLSFFQDIAHLPIDYSAYRHWRTLAERSGPRIVHPDFCMISDRPAVLKVDAQNRPHCEDGPFCEWRDGTQLYSWHGARIPARWIMEKSTIDPTEILREQNVELRAAGSACIGWPRMLSALDYKIIDADPDPSHGELIELRLEGLPKPGRFLRAECPRNGAIVEGVPSEIKTVHEAQAWRVGLAPSEFKYPEVRT